MIAKIYVPLQTPSPREGERQKAVIFRDRNQIKWRLVWSDEWQEGRWRCVTQRTLAPGKEIIAYVEETQIQIQIQMCYINTQKINSEMQKTQNRKHRTKGNRNTER